MTLLLFLATVIAAPTINVHASRYGPIAFDGRGYALDAFTADKPSRSTCYGACAAAWPPYLVGKKPTGNPLLGVARRRHGRLQVTLAGRPLYYYVGDRRPGQILCQNVPEVGGTWLVVRGNGTLVR